MVPQRANIAGLLLTKTNTRWCLPCAAALITVASNTQPASKRTFVLSFIRISLASSAEGGSVVRETFAVELRSRFARGSAPRLPAWALLSFPETLHSISDFFFIDSLSDVLSFTPRIVPQPRFTCNGERLKVAEAL